MKLTREDWEDIYSMLDDVSPLAGDCGKLCGAACCTVSQDEEMGILLLPGEEVLFEEADWIECTDEECFVNCKTPPVCPREKRPMQCRTFPLMPHIDADDELVMIYNDMELPYKCPLIEDEIPLDDDFVDMTEAAWRMLLRDERIYDMVKRDSVEREAESDMLADKLSV